jgi:hypothetical protein
MGPKIEPYGTPLYTVSKELHIFFTFTNCFLKLLGATIDYELNFDKHISEICKQKSARQLNVWKRIGRYLNKLGRLTIYYSLFKSK